MTSSSSPHLTTPPSTPSMNPLEPLSSMDSTAISDYTSHFLRFASSHDPVTGNPVMTSQDFINSIFPIQNFYKVDSSEYEVLFQVADILNSGYLTLNNFLEFNHSLSKPDADYELAFRVFDREGRGKITLKEFKDILEQHVSDFY